MGSEGKGKCSCGRSTTTLSSGQWTRCDGCNKWKEDCLCSLLIISANLQSALEKSTAENILVRKDMNEVITEKCERIAELKSSLNNADAECGHYLHELKRIYDTPAEERVEEFKQRDREFQGKIIDLESALEKSEAEVFRLRGMYETNQQRDVIQELRELLSKSESEKCAMREKMESIKKADLTPTYKYGQANRHGEKSESWACWLTPFEIAESALQSSSPCEHEKELKTLGYPCTMTESVMEFNSRVEKERDALKAELGIYKQVVADLKSKVAELENLASVYAKSIKTWDASIQNRESNIDRNRLIANIFTELQAEHTVNHSIDCICYKKYYDNPIVKSAMESARGKG